MQIDIAGYIDQALLKTEVSTVDIERLCREAASYRFKAVFVNPSYAALAAKLLTGSGVRVGTVAGFPLGATPVDVKIYEAGIGENSGAQEIDMVANIGAIRSGEWNIVRDEIAGVREALSRETILKVIIEATLLTVDEKIRVAKIVADCGADFVKTSTGMFGQATVDDVGLLFKEVGSRIGVKASGGIRTLADALVMIEAGASRIGTSSGPAIVNAQKQSK